MVTNVKAEELNYDHYDTDKYDDDIVRSIPGHVELHKEIDNIIQKDHSTSKKLKILELGIGTGLTAYRVLKQLPDADYIAVDFSKQMIDGAKLKLSDYNVNFIEGDYSEINFGSDINLVISVIGIHHQETDEDKKNLFKKIHDSLSSDGAFIFGDLVTYKDQSIAALNDSLHNHYLVEHAKDEKSLQEWAYHHKFLNKLASIEDQVTWLKDVGFKDVKVVYEKFNTALIYAKK